MIIAVDLGRHAGVALQRGDGAVVLESASLAMSVGPMMSEFEGKMRGYIRDLNPDGIFWERPFLDFRRMDAQGELRTQRLYGQAAAMHKLAHEYDVASGCERPGTMRKAVIGKGNATPEQIMSFCRKHDQNPQNDHEADAYVTLIYARKFFGK